MDQAILKKNLNKISGCNLGYVGYPCQNCFNISSLKLTQPKDEYWKAILAFRGDNPNLRQNPILIEELNKAIEEEIIKRSSR